MFRFATNNEINSWNDHLTRNIDGFSVYQMKEFAEVKQSVGWNPRFLFRNELASLALEKTVAPLGKYWYMPKGPYVRSAEDLISQLPSLKTFAQSQGVFSVKIEPEIRRSDEVVRRLVSSGLLVSDPVLPNSSTVTLDLSPSLNDIFAKLNENGRRAIRRAQKDGVTAKPVELTNESIDSMYELMRQTAEGQWTLRPKEYLIHFWRTFVNSGRGQMFFAFYEGNIVAASFGILLGINGTYKDGGSERQRKAHGVGQFLQWEMIKWMKQRGVTSYDLCGTPPSDKVNDETHPLFRVGRFKTSLRRDVTDYIGAFELPSRFFAFKLWKAIGEQYVRHRNSEWY